MPQQATQPLPIGGNWHFEPCTRSERREYSCYYPGRRLMGYVTDTEGRLAVAVWRYRSALRALYSAAGWKN